MCRSPFMTSTKYIGVDMHKESISIAVRNGAGKIVRECVIETKASMIDARRLAELLRLNQQLISEDHPARAIWTLSGARLVSLGTAVPHGY